MLVHLEVTTYNLAQVVSMHAVLIIARTKCSHRRAVKSETPFGEFFGTFIPIDIPMSTKVEERYFEQTALAVQIAPELTHQLGRCR